MFHVQMSHWNVGTQPDLLARMGRPGREAHSVEGVFCPQLGVLIVTTQRYVCRSEDEKIVAGAFVVAWQGI